VTEVIERRLKFIEEQIDVAWETEPCACFIIVKWIYLKSDECIQTAL
jgi:hypothetical protein